MATIHLVIVADTKDASIGASVVTDIERVQKNFLEYSEICEMWLSIRVIQGANFSKEKIARDVQDFFVQSNDVIAFYYTGHGYRHETKEDPWPMMFLGHDEFGAPQGFDVRWIYQMFQQKNPRLLLMITDSCQEPIPDAMHSNVTPYMKRSTGDRRNNCRQLFLQSQGEILLVSCKPGEYSYCTPDRGGFFSERVFQAIEDNLSGTQASWEVVAQESAELDGDRQNPIWRVITGDGFSRQQHAMELRGFTGWKGMDEADSRTVSAAPAPAAKSIPNPSRPQSPSYSSPNPSRGGSYQDRMAAIRQRTEERRTKATSYRKPPTGGGFCTKCGEKLIPGSAFCTSCGAKVG